MLTFMVVHDLKHPTEAIAAQLENANREIDKLNSKLGVIQQEQTAC